MIKFLFKLNLVKIYEFLIFNKVYIYKGIFKIIKKVYILDL